MLERAKEEHTLFEALDAVFWLALVKVMIVNLILSGDNGVVIDMGARSLHGNMGQQAII